MNKQAVSLAKYLHEATVAACFPGTGHLWDATTELARDKYTKLAEYLLANPPPHFTKERKRDKNLK